MSSTSLSELRAELDRTDDALLALLVRRAALSSEIGGLAAKGAVKIRPGREAQILRRLLAAERGHLQEQTVVRIWRELLAGSTALQGPFDVSVCERDPSGRPDPAYLALAREQFGALTPCSAWPTPAQALAAVSAARATVAVLPWCDAHDAAPGWWTLLLQHHAPRLHVVGRLPFWRPASSTGAPSAPALVVAASPPDPSGDDRTLLALAVPPQTSQRRLDAALAAAGLPSGRTVMQGEHALLDVDGFLEAPDARLAALTEALSPSFAAPLILGAYASPLAAAP